MDRIRYRRLEDFERKRLERKKEESRHQDEQLQQHYRVFDTGSDALHPRHDPNTDQKIGKISPILKKPKDLVPSEETNRHTLSPLQIDTPNGDDIVPNFESSAPNTPNCDDYESSTALSSSSREGDFDEIDFSKLPVIEDKNHLPTSDIQPNEEPKLSWFSRLLRKKPAQPAKVVVKITPEATKELHYDEKMSTVSLLKFFLIESRVVWRKLIADHADEWELMKLQRNRCIADFIVLTIFCGMGGIMFRFVEGAFENFYKCGVRRVKRDFVDYLWTSSHNLRLPFCLLIQF